MKENDKADTEEKKFSLRCVQDVQKDKTKNSETFQETPVECSNGSEASGEKYPFVVLSEQSWESNLHFCQ